MKIKIEYPFRDVPYGGGNQFLKALRNEFRSLNVYTDDISDASAVIVNSKDLDLPFIPKYYKGKIIHRIDGSFSIHRDDNKLDKQVYKFANDFSSGIIFQSEWSKQNHISQGFTFDKPSAVIHNACSPTIFFKENSVEDRKPHKIQLITTCWSKNLNKGFKYYKYIDDELNNCNFSELFSYTFIGNCPIHFKNIEILKPMPSLQLGRYLRDSHIFVSGVENDACSNSIIEALACGLPVLALDSGSNRELVKYGGEIFYYISEMVPNLVKMATLLGKYVQVDSSFRMKKCADEYIDFIRKVL